MRWKTVSIALLFSYHVFSADLVKNYFIPNEMQEIAQIHGGDLISAIVATVQDMPTIEVTVCYDGKLIENNFISILSKNLQKGRISVRLFNITSVEIQDVYFDFLTKQVANHFESTTLFFGHPKFYEHLLVEIFHRNLIRRNLYFIFNCGRRPIKDTFLQAMHYAMRVFVITNPRHDVFRVYYNQATSYKENHLDMINWWNEEKGLFYHPTIPKQKSSIYKNFHGKLFQVPVLNKPPWHFVKYYNSTNRSTSFEVLGGRDHRILHLLAKKLNFRYKYIDPTERVQGSPSAETGLFDGVLGMIWRREADLFLGDLGLTYERSNVVEFSFITLGDTGAFVTHAPSRLNEAWALLRPFQWQVWPAIGITFVVVGPLLYAIIVLPNVWQPRFLVRSHIRFFFDCAWFTVTIFMKQTGKEPSSTHKARFFVAVLSVSATYVITDMYSANLTSLLAKPGREKAVNNLYQLRTKMLQNGYKLYVERHSPSFELLENGTGIYGSLWNIMQRLQTDYIVDSVEEGVKLVRDSKKVAVLAGRETLFFDIQRFGPKNFHLSEKLNTAYSAIALQLGCPFYDTINKVVMTIFEAGIISKMTESEYEELNKQQQKAGVAERSTESDIPSTKIETKRAAKLSIDNGKLNPISLKMLQGAFYLICVGNLISAIILFLEIMVHRHYAFAKKINERKNIKMKKIIKTLKKKFNKVIERIMITYHNFMHDAFTQTLEYLE